MPARPGPARSRWRRALRRLRPPRRLSFTREGRWLTFLAVAIGVAAINTGNNLLYLILAWLLSFIIASGVLSEVTMRGLVVRRRPPPQIFAGQPFLMEISVENQKAGLASFSIEVEDLLDGRPLDKKCYFLKIPPGRTQRTSYRHTFARRGMYRFDGFRIATRFPFTLFRKSKDADELTEVLVYPRLVGVSRPPPRPRARGAGTSHRIGRRGEFFGLREWRQGDDRRGIHWRSTARTGRVMVREHEDELERQVTIAVDSALPARVVRALVAGERVREDAPAVDAVERAISHAASLASAYLEAGWAVGLAARGAQVPRASGRAQLIRILRELALLPPVTDEVAMAELDPRHDRVLCVPAELPAAGRPPADHVVPC
ncbi:MAG: DUF58 domain-containing protein [Kofleriaceae bacterium]|nr:DUF58 domain-containing protein [Kofleriaceae bacterium]MCL4227450.1 DUF58 domain-containing protein [Myxococcales bacterium]